MEREKKANEMARRVLGVLGTVKGRTAIEVAARLDLPEWRIPEVREALRGLQGAGLVRATLRRGARGRPAIEYRRR
jgi:predicted ArsR family transcriptional regulator